MSKSALNRATHFSIVWVVTLAVLTTVEWRSLSREPLKDTIMLPFIERQVSLEIGAGARAGEPPDDDDDSAPPTRSTTTVNIGFNGPLFLLCCFGPVLIFHGIGWVAGRVGAAARRR
jgi:hypothetical protein